MAKLERSIERWLKMSPAAVIQGSSAQTLFCIQDAQKDILTLAAALKEAQSVLAMMVAPKAIESTTVLSAFASVTETEAKCRALLSPNTTPEGQ